MDPTEEELRVIYHSIEAKYPSTLLAIITVTPILGDPTNSIVKVAGNIPPDQMKHFLEVTAKNYGTITQEKNIRDN